MSCNLKTHADALPELTWTAPSSRDPAVTYTVTADPQTGIAVTCTCPSFTYRHRACRHMRAADAGELGEPRVAVVPAAADDHPRHNPPGTCARCDGALAAGEPRLNLPDDGYGCRTVHFACPPRTVTIQTGGRTLVRPSRERPHAPAASSMTATDLYGDNEPEPFPLRVRGR